MRWNLLCKTLAINTHILFKVLTNTPSLYVRCVTRVATMLATMNK